MEEQQDAPIFRISKEQIILTGGTLLTSGILDIATHNPTTAFFGLCVTFLVARHSGDIVKHLVPGQDAKQIDAVASRVAELVVPEEYADQSASAKIKRMLLMEKGTAIYQLKQETAVPKEAEPSSLVDDTAFQPSLVPEASSIARLSVRDIVAHSKPNSYKIYFGRSLTQSGNPPVSMSIYKRHLKLIGASQKGKSSMAGALLEIITKTHDPEHVLVALLDREDRTSRLFADIPHLAEILIDDRTVLLHARNDDEVLEHLGYVVEIIKYRYALTEAERVHQPLLLVFLEEFIALKDTFKLRIDLVPKERREQARKDYATLIYCIKEIARLGLKARVQLLLCAQVDYRDEDLQEALINVTSGMSFCVRSTAAQAAGFMQSDLLNRNARENRIGQAVVEMPDCTDLVLAPEYDLEALLLELEKTEEAKGAHIPWPSDTPPFVTAAHKHQGYATKPEQSAEKKLTDIERARQAYDAGCTTLDLLSVALGISVWNTRPLLAQVKREKAME